MADLPAAVALHFEFTGEWSPCLWVPSMGPIVVTRSSAGQDAGRLALLVLIPLCAAAIIPSFSPFLSSASSSTLNPRFSLFPLRALCVFSCLPCRAGLYSPSNTLVSNIANPLTLNNRCFTSGKLLVSFRDEPLFDQTVCSIFALRLLASFNTSPITPKPWISLARQPSSLSNQGHFDSTSS